MLLVPYAGVVHLVQIEVMTSSKCATTVHAIRDSELACLPAGLLDTIKLKQPQVIHMFTVMENRRYKYRCTTPPNFLKGINIFTGMSLNL